MIYIFLKGRIKDFLWIFLLFLDILQSKSHFISIENEKGTWKKKFLQWKYIVARKIR
jgi:hypothetical protein